MLIYLSVDLPELLSQGKNYPWPRPARCPSCNGTRLWSHGYVRRNFDGFDSPLWIKRFRCPDCRSVHTVRPSGYSAFIQASRLVVFLSLLMKILFGQRLPDVCSRRQRYWFSTFKRQICRSRNVDYSDTDAMFNALTSRFYDQGAALTLFMVYFAINWSLIALHLPFPATNGGPSP